MANIILLTVLGLMLLMSPLRNNSVYIVGAFVGLSALTIFLSQTVKIEMIKAKEGGSNVEVHGSPASLGKSLRFETTNCEDGSLHIDLTTRTNTQSDLDGDQVTSSTHDVTLSSYYTPALATPTEPLSPVSEQKRLATPR